MLSLLPVRSVDERWLIATKPGMTYASLGSDLSTLHFYQLLVRLLGCKHILELGTYLGVSAMFLAEAAGPAGHVTTVERGLEFHHLALTNIVGNGYRDRISPVLGDALTILRAAPPWRAYDFILVDAAKESYGEMLDPALACLAPGGLLLFDDALMQGDTLNEAPRLAKGRGVLDLLDRLRARKDELETVMLPIGDGLLLVRRR